LSGQSGAEPPRENPRSVTRSLAATECKRGIDRQVKPVVKSGGIVAVMGTKA
jgi:hypothetical protein